jgi:hypothetical protein
MWDLAKGVVLEIGVRPRLSHDLVFGLYYLSTMLMQASQSGQARYDAAWPR